MRRGTLHEPLGGHRCRDSYPGGSPLGRPVEGTDHRFYKYEPRHRRDGHGGLEEHDLQPPAPDRRGLQGAGHAATADPAHWAPTQKGQAGVSPAQLASGPQHKYRLVNFPIDSWIGPPPPLAWPIQKVEICVQCEINKRLLRTATAHLFGSYD